MDYYQRIILLIATPFTALAQSGEIKGLVTAEGRPAAFVTVVLANTGVGGTTNNVGHYNLKNIRPGNYEILFSAVGYVTEKRSIVIKATQDITLNCSLLPNTSKLDEVVITGVSRATQLRRNPVPIMVITRREMHENVNNNVIDAIVKGVPGVNALTTGPNISKPFIRGLGYNRVLTLYDGVRQEGQQWGDEHGIEVDQYGVTRAEVIKGPASLTYGSDALAGVINLIPAVPDTINKRLHGDVIADWHANNGMMATSLGLAYKNNDWKFIFRSTGKRAHDYTNAADGFVYNTGFTEINLSAMARVNKSWGYSTIAATLYDNKQEIPDGSRDSLTRRFTKQIAEGNYDNILNRPIVSDNELQSYKIAGLHQHIQHYRVYNRTQLKIGEGSAEGALAWQQSIRREYNHPTQPQQAGLFVVLNTINYDFKYSLPTVYEIESSVGVNGMYQANQSKTGTDFPIPDYNLLDAGAYFFAHESFGRFDLSGGLRYDTRRITWADFYVGPNPNTGFDAHVSALSLGANLQFPAFNHVYRGWSGSLGVTFNITERVMLKGNIARGYRAPNITEIGSNGLDPGAHIVYLGNRSFNPEFSLQQDFGFIAYLKDVDLMAELFNNNIDGYIYQSKLTDVAGNPVVIVPGNTTYQYQQAKARLYGAEITLNLHPRSVKWLTLNNSLAYVAGLNGNKQLVDQSGGTAKYLPFIPPLHTRSEIKITLQRSYGALQKIHFKAEIDAYAAQNRFYAFDDTETATPGYTLFNLSAGASVKNKGAKTLFDVFIQADNLFNKAYQSNLNRLKYFEYFRSSANGRTGIYNMGRNLSFKIIVPF